MELMNWIYGFQKRKTQEEAIIPLLNTLEADARDVIKRVRDKADAAMRALPESGSPSSELQARFPLTLGNKVGKLL